MVTPQNLRVIGDRIEQMLGELEATAEPRVYGQAIELLRLVTELYGGGLARVVELAESMDPDARVTLADDALVGSLMIVHGLHPDALPVRVEAALAAVRPLLATHGGDVELLDVDMDVGAVHLRLLGSCDGCPSSTITLRSAVEQAILEAAPEIVCIDVDEPSAAASSPAGTSIPVTLSVKPRYDSCPSEVGA